AISLYLADNHPEAGLAPRIGEPDRGDYLKWMVLFTNAFQSEFRAWFYAHEFVDKPAYVDSVKAATAGRIEATYGRLAQHLANNRGLLGDRFSPADLSLFMFIRWGRVLPNPPKTHDVLGRYAEAT